MILYKLNAIIGFIPVLIAFSFYKKMSLPSKFLFLSIFISILTEASTTLTITFLEIRTGIIVNLYAIIFFIFTGLAYSLKVKNVSPKLGSIFIYLASACIILHIGIHIKHNIHTMQELMYMSFCVYCVLFSLFYFYYVVVLNEEIDLLKDSFFLLTAGFFIYYMVSTIVHYSNLSLNKVDSASLYEFKDYVYTFYLIIITIAFIIDRNKLVN